MSEERVQCLTCMRFSLKDSPMGKNGFGRCALRRDLWTYPSATYKRVCDKHKVAVDAEQRVDWYYGKRRVGR